MSRKRRSRRPAARAAGLVAFEEQGGFDLAPVVPLRRAGAPEDMAQTGEHDLAALRVGCDEIRRKIAALSEVIAALEAARRAGKRQKT